MKFLITLLIVLCPTTILGLLVFHMAILPYAIQFGFVVLMLSTCILAYMLGLIGDHYANKIHAYLDRRFP